MFAESPVIDADSHVEEADEVWDCLEERYQDRRPRVVSLQGVPGVRHIDAFWLVDGQIYPKPVGHGATIMGTPTTSSFAKAKPISVQSQSLLNVDSRLKDLDHFGIDVQVNFPTVFLQPLTQDVHFEAALMRAYSSWMAARSGERPDRLRWAAPLPLRSPEDALREVRRAKDLGAICVAVFGTAGGMMLHDQAFDAVWEECARLRMPVGVHIGWSHPGLLESCDSIFSSQIIGISMPLFLGFFSFIGGGILDRHPTLKVAFLEAGAGWTPYMIERMDHYYAANRDFQWPWGLPRQRPSDYLKGEQVYVTCEGDERLLPQAIECLGEDRLLVAGDIPHAEERENSVHEIAERNDISISVKRKILSDNGRRFFGL